MPRRQKRWWHDPHMLKLAITLGIAIPASALANVLMPSRLGLWSSTNEVTRIRNEHSGNTTTRWLPRRKGN